MRRLRAVTLIELLVVVGILALLVAILLPSLGKARESSRRALCASRLRAQGQAVSSYAVKYSDALPVYPAAPPALALPGVKSFLPRSCTPVWWYDQSPEFVNGLLDAVQPGTMILAGYPPNKYVTMFYCPSFEERINVGWFLVDHRSLGYGWLNDRGPQGGALIAMAKMPSFFPNRTPPLKLLTRLVGNRYLGQTELAFDGIVYGRPPASSFSNFQAGVSAPEIGAVTQRTNHLDGSKAAGGNFLLCDSHVEWRKMPGSKADMTVLPSANEGSPPDGAPNTGPDAPFFVIPNS